MKAKASLFWQLLECRTIVATLAGFSVLLSFAEAPSASLERKDFVVSLVDSVSIERMEHDLARLVYKNPAKPYDNDRENLRTRYARHPDCWDSAGTYIRDRLIEALGDSSLVEVVSFKHALDDTMYNIIGTLRGDNDGYYIYCAHYDDTAHNSPDWDWRTDPAPGADDNGSGVVSVLEAARVLSRSGLRLPFSIKFILFSGEEFRMLGSKRYAQKAVERGDNILGVINSDMIGYNGLTLDIIGDPRSQWLVDLIGETNDTYDIGLTLRKSIDPLANRGDHAAFWEEGYSATWFIEHYPPEETNPQYDSMGDVISSDSLNYHLNFHLIAKATKLCVATLAQFVPGRHPLPDLAISQGDVRYSEEEGGFLVTIRNMGDAPVEPDFRFDILVKECDLDSSGCRGLHQSEVVFETVPAGGYRYVIKVPWKRTVQTVLQVEVDPEDKVLEKDETNNTLYQPVRRPRAKVVEITEDYVYPNPCYNGELWFHYQLSKEATIRIEVFNGVGEKVWEKEIPPDQQKSCEEGISYGANYGLNEPRWDCRNANGTPVSSGLYIYRISAFDKGDVEPSDCVFGRFAVIR